MTGTPGAALIVGEAGRGPSPFEGRGSSSRRLRDVAGDDFRLYFDVVNLLPEWPGKDGKGDRFPMPEARAAAAMVLELAPHRTLILAGRRVASAFGLRSVEYLDWTFLRRRIVGVVPHPSGVVRWWNSPTNVEAAKTFFREARPFFRDGRPT